jgi:VirE N-terminal domain
MRSGNVKCKRMQQRKTSLFTHFGDTEPKTVNVYDFITSLQYRSKIEKIRKSKNDPDTITRLKQSLPFITPACVCEDGHKKIVSQNGLISIDCDNGRGNNKNTHIQGQEQWVRFIMSLQDFSNVFYAGLSASGNGCYVILPLKYPDRFIESFLGIQYAFKKELNVDIEQGCHNINRLRFASYNILGETSFANTEATDWRYLIEQVPVKEGGKYVSGIASIAVFRSLARHVETRSKNPQSFTSGSRHAFTIALAGACAWANIPVEQTVEWISDEYWSKEPDYLSRIDSEVKGIGDAYIHAEGIGRAKHFCKTL